MIILFIYLYFIPREKNKSKKKINISLLVSIHTYVEREERRNHRQPVTTFRHFPYIFYFVFLLPLVLVCMTILYTPLHHMLVVFLRDGRVSRGDNVWSSRSVG